MTLDEIKEKYGDIELKFCGYYKYVFSFIGKTKDDEDIYVEFGGNASDIYNIEIYPDVCETINSLYEPFYIEIKKENNIILLWSNY